MTTTLIDVNSKKKPEFSAEAQAAQELVRLAKEQGLSLTGPSPAMCNGIHQGLVMGNDSATCGQLGITGHRCRESACSTPVVDSISPTAYTDSNRRSLFTGSTPEWLSRYQCRPSASVHSILHQASSLDRQ
jgi:hypothetical protein